MRLIVAVSVAVVLMAMVAQQASGERAIFCYWGSWSVYRYGMGTFTADMIPATLCTHLVYAFAGLDQYTYTIKSLDPWCDLSSSEGGGLNNYANAINAKWRNPNLKVVLSIGGWNEGSVKYSQMVSYPSTRKTFIDSAVAWLLRYGFDGLDMDWEYPAQRGGLPQDKDNFSLLLKELKEAFAPHGLILTAAVAGIQSAVDMSYDVAEITKYVDYLNVMSYEYYNYYDEPYLRHQSPMANRPGEDPTRNVNYTMNYFVSKGAPPQKLLLGIVSDARTYISDANHHNIGDPAYGPGQPGPYTQSAGYLSAYEVCSNIKNGWTVDFDEIAQAPYSYGGSLWAAYDNDRSAGVKVELIKSMNLGGVMFWSLDMDDCRHVCSTDKECYLLGCINQHLYGN